MTSLMISQIKVSIILQIKSLIKLLLLRDKQNSLSERQESLSNRLI